MYGAIFFKYQRSLNSFPKRRLSNAYINNVILPSQKNNCKTMRQIYLCQHNRIQYFFCCYISVSDFHQSQVDYLHGRGYCQQTAVCVWRLTRASCSGSFQSSIHELGTDIDRRHVSARLFGGGAERDSRWPVVRDDDQRQPTSTRSIVRE